MYSYVKGVSIYFLCGDCIIGWFSSCGTPTTVGMRRVVCWWATLLGNERFNHNLSWKIFGLIVRLKMY